MYQPLCKDIVRHDSKVPLCLLLLLLLRLLLLLLLLLFLLLIATVRLKLLVRAACARLRLSRTRKHPKFQELSRYRVLNTKSCQRVDPSQPTWLCKTAPSKEGCAKALVGIFAMHSARWSCE